MNEQQDRQAGQLLIDERGATMLEWTLLLVAIGLPSYWMSRLALQVLIEHYQMMTTLNGMPLP